MSRVTLIDTSILCELLQVPDKCQQHADVHEEFVKRADAGEQFIIPITAVIETGNHIAQASSGRRSAAERLERFLDLARSSTVPFVLNTTSWDDAFLTALCDGDSTGQSLIDLLGNGQMGAGDITILVERDQFQARSALQKIGIWTLDAVLGAYC
jgi:hypothetical protein